MGGFNEKDQEKPHGTQLTANIGSVFLIDSVIFQFFLLATTIVISLPLETLENRPLWPNSDLPG